MSDPNITRDDLSYTKSNGDTVAIYLRANKRVLFTLQRSGRWFNCNELKLERASMKQALTRAVEVANELGIHLPPTAAQKLARAQALPAPASAEDMRREMMGEANVEAG